ncbi:MAG: RHS repeat-associated core domain-containing protein [Myxococcota bacterium]
MTPILTYDPVGRNTEVTLPDGHVRRWTYTPWQVSAYDEHDLDPTSPFHDTPATTHLDAQGRVFGSTETPDGVAEHVTHLTLDVQGNVRQVTDARGNATQVQTFDLLGRPLFTGAADEGYDGVSGQGETRILVDVAGQPLRVWRSGNLSLRTAYDALRRPVGTWVDEGAGERRSTRTVYGDALPEPPPFGKGRPVQVDDPAGRVTLGYDFRGRTVAQTRQVMADITLDADWDADPALDPERFTVTTGYDALDRVTSEVSPDGSNTTRTYDEGGRLVTVAVAVRGAAATSFVDHIAYDARGQRLAVTHGNGTATTYTYDPFRFWLTRLHTLRGSTALQDLQYTLDAVGNIVEIRDDAQQTEFFANSQVTPTRTFTYDALYRLTRATGREKVDQRQTTAFYAEYAGATGAISDPADPALRQYTQSYRYDGVGNLLEMKHQQGLGGMVAWRRGYAHEPSNNQLVSTSAPGDDPDDPSTHTNRYPYNERGAMTAMPHLPALVRDPQDQIRRADLDLAGSVAWYAYDAGGQRVRKRVDKGGVQEERIYVGGYEVWRKRTGSRLQEERQTLHVMDDQLRIALVETLTVTNGSAVPNPTPRQRYQLGDHLGTATLEVDELGALIGYEEYHPHGSTSWWASASDPEVSAKRYRYTGRERDEETGLAYHTARYYIPWLGRWERPDPAGGLDGPNRFIYCRGQPIGARDPHGRWTDDDLALRSDAREGGGGQSFAAFAGGFLSALVGGFAYAVGAPGRPVDVMEPEPHLLVLSVSIFESSRILGPTAAENGQTTALVAGVLSFSRGVAEVEVGTPTLPRTRTLQPQAVDPAVRGFVHNEWNPNVLSERPFYVTVEPSKTSQVFAEGAIVGSGTLEMTINAKQARVLGYPDASGGFAFQNMVRAAEATGEMNSIRGVWIEDPGLADNLAGFRAAGGGPGATTEQNLAAARATWTGEQAAKAGYTEVQIESVSQRMVRVLFTKSETR